jgi:hypothetical protein
MRKSKYSKATTIALTPEHFEQIKQITDDREISLAQWVREAVATALIKNQHKEKITNDE